MSAARPQGWSAAELTALVNARLTGATLRQLGPRFGVSHQQIHTLLWRHARCAAQRLPFSAARRYYPLPVPELPESPR